MPKLKKRPDGRYRCRYHNIDFYGDTEKEALAKRAEYIRQEQLRPHVSRTSVKAYAMEWLPIHKHGVSDKTYNDYAKQMEVLISALGDMELSAVRPSDAKAVYLHYDGYSDSTIKRSRQLFVSLFDAAIDDGYAVSNPFRAKTAAAPKGTEGTHRALTQHERDLVHSVEHPFRPAVMCMLYAGLRRGEVLALDVDRDVDFVHNIIHVHEAVRYDSNQAILSTPKTDAGTRDVPLLPVLADELRGRHGLVARTVRTGKHMTESSFKSAWHSYILALECHINGVKQKRWRDPSRPWVSISIRTHDFRHTYCTMLRDAGVDIKIAMQWMGHADEKMILEIYDHVTDYRQQTEREKLEKMAAMVVGGQNGGQAKIG